MEAPPQSVSNSLLKNLKPDPFFSTRQASLLELRLRLHRKSLANITRHSLLLIDSQIWLAAKLSEALRKRLASAVKELLQLTKSCGLNHENV
jgi:hypothetical protein